VDYRSGSTNQPVDHWYQADTLGGRIKNIGRAAAAGIGRLGDAALDAGAALARKTGIAGATAGVVGLFGGAKAAANVNRAFGGSNNRISHAEKA
jgi:hypothetical protein